MLCPTMFGIGAEALPPEVLAENHGSPRVRQILFRREHAAGEQWRPKRVEELGGHLTRLNALEHVATLEIQRDRPKRRHVLEHVGLRAVVHVLARRRGRPRDRAVVRVHRHDERVGRLERNGLQQHGVDDGEDRDVDADAERQREDGGRREHRVFAKRPPGVLDVFAEGVHGAGPFFVRRRMIGADRRAAYPLDAPNRESGFAFAQRCQALHSCDSMRRDHRLRRTPRICATVQGLAPSLNLTPPDRFGRHTPAPARTRPCPALRRALAGAYSFRSGPALLHDRFSTDA